MKIDKEKLSQSEYNYLYSILCNGNFPDLKGIWSLMDAAWDECNCDPLIDDERISKFYRHPVWLLNGLFIEQHEESLDHRREFTNYVAELSPKLIADFGGGYGTLARMIGSRCPESTIHIVEPHPNSYAISRTEQSMNVQYVPKLMASYDILIAIDLFEHIFDPISLVENTAKHLRIGGEYLIANCFWPVIKCHLPSLFHFRYSWDIILKKMNLKPSRKISYGRIYRKIGPITTKKARKIERCSIRWFPFLKRIPPDLHCLINEILLRFS